MDLTGLFPDVDFQFVMGIKRVPPQSYFAQTPEVNQLLNARKAVLNTASACYYGLLASGETLLEAAIQFAMHWSQVRCGDWPGNPGERCLALGRSWEPDFLLLRPMDSGDYQLVGGCVCFPSHWDFAAKLGKPLKGIHGVVPKVNDSLGSAIQKMLARLRPGLAWTRNNWGLSASGERNLHPSQKAPRLRAGVVLDQVWLRVERQALVALPNELGILFAIRVEICPLQLVKENVEAAAGLQRALRTMPESIARYKGLDTARADLNRSLDPS